MDSHAHLQHEQFDADRDAVIERAAAAGIERILVPGWDVGSSEAALELAERHGPMVAAAVGVHPHYAADLDEAGWARLESLVADPRVRAIGEIGLDHFRNLSPQDLQRDAFRRQLALADRRGLPVLVHDRDAHEPVTEELLAWQGQGSGAGVRGVLHAFSGGPEMAARLVSAGFLVSFALPLAFRSAAGPRAAAATVPEGAFLVETDAPYLGPDRARRNEPATALRVTAELARLRGEEPGSLVGQIREAFERLIVERANGRPGN